MNTDTGRGCSSYLHPLVPTHLFDILVRGDYKIEKQIPLIAFDEWRLRENEPHREQMARDESNRALRRLHAYEQQPDGTNNTGHPAINGQRRAPPYRLQYLLGFMMMRNIPISWRL